MRFFSNIRLLLTGLWFGAAVFFIGTAQNAFAVLPSRELAGAVVSRNLLLINVGGLIIGLILLGTSFVKSALQNRFALWTERLMLIILAAACAAGQFVIAVWMSMISAQLRAQTGKPIEEIAADDPLKIQFDQLHQYSVWVLMAAMAAALIAFFLIAQKSDKKVVAGGNVIDATNQFKF